MNDELPEDQTEISDGVFTFRGKALERFSFDRQAAAQRLSDESIVENDVLLVYLCLTPLDEVLSLRGNGPVAAFRKKMGQWADQNKITIYTKRDAEGKVIGGNKARMEISTIAQKIWEDLALADFEPELRDPKGPESPNVTG